MGKLVTFSVASKTVGWEMLRVSYPTVEEVLTAYEANDIVSVLRWNRFLPSPMTPKESNVINAVVKALVALRKICG